jgi:hypothetical protein
LAGGGGAKWLNSSLGRLPPEQKAFCEFLELRDTRLEFGGYLNSPLALAPHEWKVTTYRLRPEQRQALNGAPDRASPNFMGLASLRLDISMFCDSLYSVLLSSVFWSYIS